MEIKKIATPKAVGIEVKKQTEQVKDTSLKNDSFEKTGKAFDVNEAMKKLEDIKLKDGGSMFDSASSQKTIREELEKHPENRERTEDSTVRKRYNS